MKPIIQRIAVFVLALCLLPVDAQQQTPPLPRQPHNLDPDHYFNQAGWYPQSVSYAPDESNLLVGVCPYSREQARNMFYFPSCTLLRYQIDTAQWQALPDIDKTAHYSEAAYTFDGQAIFASETAKCPVIPYVAPQRASCRLFVLLDLNGKKIKNLSSYDMDYAYPSLTRNGEKVLFWGLSDQLYPGMGGGAWDVKEFDIERQRVRQLTDYQAAFPKTAPRLMPDGKQLMLAAEEYPKLPNPQDFMKPDPRTGAMRQVYYVSKYGRNMTVVVGAPNAPIRPYFPTDGHMWLIVRDISRDGKLAVFDNRGVGICFRFIEEPQRKEDCFSNVTQGHRYKVSYAIAASISPSNQRVAVLSEDGRADITTRLYLIDVATGEPQLIPLAW